MSDETLRLQFFRDTLPIKAVRENQFPYPKIFSRDEFNALQHAVEALHLINNDERKQMRAAIAVILNNFSHRVLHGLGVASDPSSQHLATEFLNRPIEEGKVNGKYYYRFKGIEIPIYNNDTAIRLLLSTLHETMHMFQHFIFTNEFTQHEEITNEQYQSAIQSFFKTSCSTSASNEYIQHLLSYLAQDDFFGDALFDILKKQTLAFIDTTKYHDKLIEAHAMVFAIHAARHVIDCTGWSTPNLRAMQSYIDKAEFQENRTSNHTLGMSRADFDKTAEIFAKCRVLMRKIDTWAEDVPAQSQMNAILNQESKALQSSIDIIQQYSLQTNSIPCSNNTINMPCPSIQDFYEQLLQIVKFLKTDPQLSNNTYVDIDNLNICVEIDDDKEKPDIGDERD